MHLLMNNGTQPSVSVCVLPSYMSKFLLSQIFTVEVLFFKELFTSCNSANKGLLESPKMF